MRFRQRSQREVSSFLLSVPPLERVSGHFHSVATAVLGSIEAEASLLLVLASTVALGSLELYDTWACSTETI